MAEGHRAIIAHSCVQPFLKAGHGGAGSNPPGGAWGRVQQRFEERACCVPQQEQPRQPQQEPRVSCGGVHVLPGPVDRSYRPGAYTSFWIHEPKRRLISAAPFRDRIVHHALCNLIEPIFERVFIVDSFANRKGKGTHRALTRAQELARRWRYLVQLDVRQFFPSVDHELLKIQLARRIDDLGILDLIDRILASGEGVQDAIYDLTFFPGDTLLAILRPRGLPIGNLTSQFWANVYLNPFDHFVKRELRCCAYVRYVDDLLLFGNDKRQLWQWITSIEPRLASLRLRVHPGAHPRPVAEGFPFLGFTVFPERRRLKRRKGVHFQRRLIQLVRDRRAGLRNAADLSTCVRGWINHARFGNTVGLRKAVLRRALRP
jgi:hypothetical protein